MTETKRKPGRPPIDDPKVAVSLRVRRSVLAAYQTKGGDWRSLMEGAVAAGLQKPPSAPERQERVKTAKSTSQAAVSAPVLKIQVGQIDRKPGSLLKTPKR